MSEFCLKQVQITINGIEVRVDLIAIEIKEFDVTLRVDFWKTTMQLLITAKEESFSSLA